ncbi:MAG: hypothetical protein JEZ11_05600 [Desulfobacterales bacterium]|nr:hypothetical protein [Desulfobacterales bacterium]
MIIVPKTDPIIKNLNSYYLNIERLIEHYRGELASGGIHFVSNTAEGILFFDDIALLGGVMEDKTGRISGTGAIASIIATLQNNNFTVAIYGIDPDIIHFWARLPEAIPLHSDLSAEFTDIERLIAKMSSEKLTGFIDVSFAKGGKNGILFFNDGNIVNCTCSWKADGVDNLSGATQQLLVQAVRKAPDGVFNVSRIPLEKATQGVPEIVPDIDATEESASKAAEPTLAMAQDLLLILEKTVKTHKKKQATDFGKLLRKKFIKKAERYDFLDPFSGEFEYADGTIRYKGSAEIAQVLQGVIESAKELADELGLLYEFVNNTAPWKEKYASETSGADIDI